VLGEPHDRQGTEVNVAHAAAARDDQATVRPPFDPAEFARQSERSTVPPPAQVPDLEPVITGDSTMEVLFLDADTIVVLAVAREDLEWFDLSADIRDLLQQVDGTSSLSHVCTRAGRSVDDGIALVEQLVRDGVLAVK
jgi:hypothetical protein